MNFKTLIFIMSIYLAIPSGGEDIKKVDTFIQQTGRINKVKLGDDEAVKIKNSLDEDGDIITEAELRKIEKDEEDEEDAITIDGDKVVIHDTHHRKEPKVQIVNEGDNIDLIDDIELDLFGLLR